MSNSIFTTKKMVTLAILSAIGTVLMFVELPFNFWLKFDLSDIVVYLAAIIFGPVGAILVAFVKSLLHFVIKGGYFGVPIGEFIAFLSSIAYALPLYYLTMLFKKQNKNHYVVKYSPVVISALIMTIIMVALNYFIFTELFLKLILAGDITKIGTITHEQVMATILDQGDWGLKFVLPSWIEQSSFLPKDKFFWFIIITYVPFNLLKAGLLSALYIVLSYRLDFVIKKFEIADKSQSLLLQINE